MKKTIQLKNIEIFNIVRALSGEGGLLVSKNRDLPVSVLWTINSNYKTLNGIFERIKEEEKKINDDYFIDEEKWFLNDDGIREVKDEFKEEFVNKKEELFEIPNDVDISMLRLADIEGFSLSPVEFNSIEFMITDEE